VLKSFRDALSKKKHLEKFYKTSANSLSRVEKGQGRESSLATQRSMRHTSVNNPLTGGASTYTNGSAIKVSSHLNMSKISDTAQAELFSQRNNLGSVNE